MSTSDWGYVETLEPSSRTNWDGQLVEAGPWLESEVFTIGDIKVTNKHLIYSSGGFVALILIVVAICAIVSFYKRREIVEVARRASDHIRFSIRKSFEHHERSNQ